MLKYFIVGLITVAIVAKIWSNARAEKRRKEKFARKFELYKRREGGLDDEVD